MFADKLRLLALTLVACMIFSHAATAKASVNELEGVSFQKRFSEKGVLLELTGIGLLRYKMFFKVYVAGFYLEAGAKSEQALEDVLQALKADPGKSGIPYIDEPLRRFGQFLNYGR